MKLDKYHTLTEENAAYLAAPVLHPAFRWLTVESQWAYHPDWLVRGKAVSQTRMRTIERNGKRFN
jgi:hypothetical protein